MDPRKERGRPALATPSALNKVRKQDSTANAANDQLAAEVFVGRALRALRRIPGRRKAVPPAGRSKTISEATVAPVSSAAANCLGLVVQAQATGINRPTAVSIAGF